MSKQSKKIIKNSKKSLHAIFQTLMSSGKRPFTSVARLTQPIGPSTKVKNFTTGLTPTTRKNIICVGILMIIALGLGVNVWYKNRPTFDIQYSTVLPDSSMMESHILAVGDIYWGRRMNDWSQQSRLKEAYPFSRLHEFQKELYDVWIGNLECPAVPGVKHPIGFVPELWDFNCDVDYLPEAAKWFEVFSLANNHTQNQKREAGLEATREQLDKHDIQHFGHFNAHVKDDICEVIALPARARLGGKQQDIRLPVALCGFSGVYYTITDRSIEVMRNYAEVMPVIAFPHMGQEYQAVPDDIRRGLYRKMIDNGADIVLGNHPHWVQPSEVYKGKLITYSLGNFIFDQQFSQEVMRSAAIDILMTLPQGAIPEEHLRTWAELGLSCTRFKDDCLAKAQAQNLQRLPVHFSFDVIGVDTSNEITKRAKLRARNAILERLDWTNTQESLRDSSR